MDILMSFSNLVVDDSGIDYNIAKEDFDLSPEQIQEAIKKANASIQDDALVKEGKGAAEYLIKKNEDVKSSFINSEVLPSWREQMENVTKDILPTGECSGFYDCIIWSFGELYQLVDSVGPDLLPGAQTSLPELEAQAYRLFDNDSLTFTEIKSITLEMLRMLRTFNGESVFCGTVPVIEENPANITSASGEDVVLSCSIDSVPPPTYYWYKDEELFASGMTVGTLMLKTVSAEDSGEYVCVGGNHVSNVTSHPASLNVIVLPKILKELPSNMDVAEGEQVTVLCNVSAIPDASITWYMASDNTFQVHNSTLFFHAAKLADSGVYRCEARNGNGLAVSNDMRITVLETSAPCVTVTLQVGLLYGNAQGVSLNETLVQKDFTGLSLDTAFRQTILTVINSTDSQLSAKVMISSTVSNTADVALTAGCGSNCTDSNCQAVKYEFLTALVVKLQAVIVTDKPLFILDGLVYNFNPSIINPPDLSTECPPGFKENLNKICVKWNDGAPQSLRMASSIKFGDITAVVINWDSPKNSLLLPNPQVYQVTVSTENQAQTDVVFSTAYGLLLRPVDGETTVRVRTLVNGVFGPYAELVISVQTAGSGDNFPAFLPGMLM